MRTGDWHLEALGELTPGRSNICVGFSKNEETFFWQRREGSFRRSILPKPWRSRRSQCVLEREDGSPGPQPGMQMEVGRQWDDAGEAGGNHDSGFAECGSHSVPCGEPRYSGEWQRLWLDHLCGFVEDGLEKTRQVARRPVVMNSTWKTSWQLEGPQWPSNLVLHFISDKLRSGKVKRPARRY